MSECPCCCRRPNKNIYSILIRWSDACEVVKFENVNTASRCVCWMQVVVRLHSPSTNCHAILSDAIISDAEKTTETCCQWKSAFCSVRATLSTLLLSSYLVSHIRINRRKNHMRHVLLDPIMFFSFCFTLPSIHIWLWASVTDLIAWLISNVMKN